MNCGTGSTIFSLKQGYYQIGLRRLNLHVSRAKLLPLMALLNCAVDFLSSTKSFRHNSLLIFECSLPGFLVPNSTLTDNVGYEYCGVFSR